MFLSREKFIYSDVIKRSLQHNNLRIVNNTYVLNIKWEWLNVGTVSMFKMHNVATVPTYKMHNVGTVPTFKMHNIGTPNFIIFFSFYLDCMAKINDRSMRSFFLLKLSMAHYPTPLPLLCLGSKRDSLFKKWHFKACLAFSHYFRKVPSMFQWPGRGFLQSVQKHLDPSIMLGSRTGLLLCLEAE